MFTSCQNAIRKLQMYSVKFQIVHIDAAACVCDRESNKGYPRILPTWYSPSVGHKLQKNVLCVAQAVDIN